MANELLDRLVNFAVRVGRVADALPDTRLGRHISTNLVRCGTSPAPAYEEARFSAPDELASKMALCLKDLREAGVWIRILVKSDLMPPERLTGLLEECGQLCALIEKAEAKENANKTSSTS